MGLVPTSSYKLVVAPLYGLNRLVGNVVSIGVWRRKLVNVENFSQFHGPFLFFIVFFYFLSCFSFSFSFFFVLINFMSFSFSLSHISVFFFLSSWFLFFPFCFLLGLHGLGLKGGALSQS